MKPFRLLHLLQYISQKTTCPNCKGEIMPENIKIKTSTKNVVFLNIFCEKCKKKLSAHVAITPQNSKQVNELEKFHNDIASNEIYKTEKFFQNFSGKFSDFF